MMVVNEDGDKVCSSCGAGWRGCGRGYCTTRCLVWKAERDARARAAYDRTRCPRCGEGGWPGWGYCSRRCAAWGGPLQPPSGGPLDAAWVEGQRREKEEAEAEVRKRKRETREAEEAESARRCEEQKAAREAYEREWAAWASQPQREASAVKREWRLRESSKPQRWKYRLGDGWVVELPGGELRFNDCEGGRLIFAAGGRGERGGEEEAESEEVTAWRVEGAGETPRCPPPTLEVQLLWTDAAAQDQERLMEQQRVQAANRAALSCRGWRFRAYGTMGLNGYWQHLDSGVTSQTKPW